MMHMSLKIKWTWFEQFEMLMGCLIHHNLVSSLRNRRKMDNIPLHSDIITSLQHAIGLRSIMLLPALHNFQKKVAANKIQNTHI